MGAGAQEKVDLSEERPDLTDELRRELMAYLESQNARYPRPDPGYDPELAAQRERFFRDTLLHRLEAEREAMFEEGWRPRGGWWNSK